MDNDGPFSEHTYGIHGSDANGGDGASHNGDNVTIRRLIKHLIKRRRSPRRHAGVAWFLDPTRWTGNDDKQC